MKLWQWLASLLVPKPAKPTPAPPPPPAFPEDLSFWIDAARAKWGKPAMSPLGQLDMIAQMRAERMNARHILSHDGFAVDVVARFPNQAVAENIAKGEVSASQVVDDWLASPGHRQNLLGDYNRVGTGHAGPFWVMDVARV